MALEQKSPCKVNLLLNILGQRPDGFHELETVMHPVNLFDEIRFARGGDGIQLTCNEPALPVDSKNLVYRAADAFLKLHHLRDGVRIHLQKRIPLAAGLGGGSGNAATTLLALNELFDQPLSTAKLNELAASLGSDVPFFLQNRPALATGRGEKIQPLDFFPALRGKAFLLIHPGFGISTRLGISKPRAVSGGIERPAGPRGKIGSIASVRGFARRQRRILQCAGGARVGKISRARAVPGISARKRCARRAHVRQRFDDVCHRRKCRRRRIVGGKIQIEVRAELLDGGGADLKSSKHQHPSSKEAPNSNSKTGFRPLNLEFGD